jgi:hypothetical protein
MELPRASDLKAWTSALFASLATAVGAEVVSARPDLALWIKILIVAVFPALSTVIVGAVFAFLQSSTRGRRLLSGGSWIEGYWLITTLPAEPEDSPMLPGLMYVSYTGADAHLSVVVYRVHMADGQPLLKASESTLATMRESDHHFVNVCMQRSEQNEDKALGVGTFLRDGSQRYPTRYEGWMIRLTEGVYRIQVAERLSDDVVSDNQRRFGRDWIAATIQQAAAQPFVRSDVSLPPGLDQPLAGR